MKVQYDKLLTLLSTQRCGTVSLLFCFFMCLVWRRGVKAGENYSGETFFFFFFSECGCVCVVESRWELTSENFLGT